MRLLLDTHTFVWWDSQPARLSPKALALCQDQANTLLLSVASVWEIQIKHQLGKLQLAMPLADLIASHQQSNSLRVLPVELPHVFALDDLPMYPKDPFDRLLVAQAHIEGIVLVSQDTVFTQYPIDVRW